MLDIHIENATLSLKRLTLIRELQEAREQRQAAKENHARLVQHHEAFSSSVAKRIHSGLHGNGNRADYMSAAESQYECIPAQYVVRQHAELIKVVRSQELLETYIRLVEQQNHELIEDLTYTRDEMLSELKHQQDQQKQRASIIREQMFQHLVEKVKCAHQDKSGKHPSILRSLVLRNARTRAFVFR